MFLALASAGFRIESSFRAQFWFKLLSGVLNVIARVSIWQSVFPHDAGATDVSLPQMVTYAILGATMFSTWDASQILREVGADIRGGNVVSHLMRPASYPVSLLARQLGVRAHEILVIGLPVAVVMGAVYGFQPPASVGHAALFVLSLMLSLFLLFTLSAAISMIGFWVMDMLALDWFLRGTLALLSGGLVPLWFYPDGVVNAILYLPFAWIGFYPLAIYLGKLDLASSLLHLLYGFGWAAVSAGLLTLLWRAACRRMVVQGG
jgi:ABC-2 type transport system permease protein